MKYHDQLIKYRLATGKRPLAVFLDDYPYAPNKYAEEMNSPAVTPRVNIAGDFVEGLDLRFIYGLEVLGSCIEESRAKALFKRAMLFKPVVLSVTVVPDRRQPYGAYWMGLYTKYKGVICE